VDWLVRERDSLGDDLFDAYDEFQEEVGRWRCFFGRSQPLYTDQHGRITDKSKVGDLEAPQVVVATSEFKIHTVKSEEELFNMKMEFNVSHKC
jgi:hypothetical protein